MQIRLLQPAVLEIEEAYHFYEAQSRGLGTQYMDDILQTMRRIKAHPEAWPLFSDRTRRCLTSKFPYGIIYQIQETVILVAAVAHLHRKPDYWKDRLP